MAQPTLRPDSLVLYKSRPARIVALGDKKIDVQTESGNVSVRPKDVTPLHPGPLRSLGDLPTGDPTPSDEILLAWELLAGQTTTLAEAAELAFDDFTPQSAWAIWQLTDDGLYFSGSPDALAVHDAESVAATQATRAAKAAEEQRWTAFLLRLNSGTFAPEDAPYLRDVEELALAQRRDSRVLQALGREETWQDAHALLLDIGRWDETVDPYSVRADVPQNTPDFDLPTLDPNEPRRDLTHLIALAIDDADSSDPDDALSWQPGEHGEPDRLWIHVADVAALVAPGSPADLEARNRVANLYLPQQTFPMLPPAATHQLALGLSDKSTALSFGLTFDGDGALDHAQTVVTPSRVRVTRLTYDEAEARLDSDPLLQTLHERAQAFCDYRREQGAVELDFPEVKVRVQADADGAEQIVLTPLPSLRSRNLVREAMLMAGEAVAHYAQQHELAVPYSTQETAEPIDLPADATLAQMFAARRHMRSSQQRTQPGRHAGLGLEMYTQSTSPLRRYLDLVVHQQLRAHLRGAPTLDEGAITERIGAASATYGSLRRAERRSNTHWTLVYLQRYLAEQGEPWQGEGIVVEERGARHVVIVPELGLETEVYAKGTLELDERVSLQFESINLPELEARLRVV